MRVIGLTGGIASGKSTVARLLAQRGVPVVDADQLARDAVVPGSPALAAIAAAFGADMLLADGTLNRQRLGERVFGDAEARRRLEAIMHPAIGDLARARLAELAQARQTVAIYMAPLLIEAGAADRVDEIWVVYVDQETQVARLMARDGMPREQALSRIAAQMPMSEKKKYGRLVIDNSGTPEELAARVDGVWREELQGEMGDKNDKSPV